jgi:hypothetical protein
MQSMQNTAPQALQGYTWVPEISGTDFNRTSKPAEGLGENPQVSALPLDGLVLFL